MPHGFRNVSVALVAALLLGCGQGAVDRDAAGEGDAPDAANAAEDFVAELRLKLETAASGDVIEVPEGVFSFDRGCP